MYRSVLSTFFAVMAFSSFAIEQFSVPENSALGQKRAKLRERIGPIIAQPGSQRGKVALVDLQSLVADTNFIGLAKTISNKTHYNIAYTKGQGEKVSLDAIDSLCEKFPAQVRLFIVDDQTMPIATVAPDDHWAVINVRKLEKGLSGESAKARFLAPRARKQCLRALSLLSGVNTRFENNPCSATSLIELDAVGESLPMDVQQKLTKYLDAAGLSPKVYKPYRAACREGWAPAPTNDIEKAIWDQVHEIPSEPIKIKLEKK